MADARADAAGDDGAALASLMDGWSDSDWLSVLAPAASATAACGQSYGAPPAGSDISQLTRPSAFRGHLGQFECAGRRSEAYEGDEAMELSTGSFQSENWPGEDADARFSSPSQSATSSISRAEAEAFSSPAQSAGSAGSRSTVELSPGRSQRSQAAQRGARATRDSNVTRKREREELQSLQVEAHELERQLASTQMLRGSPVAGRDRGEMWARVARNQVAAKQRAELQNAALREILREQLRMAQSMQRMMNRRPSETALSRALGSRHSSSKRVRCDPELDENQVFQVLFGKVDQALADIDSVFSVDTDMRGHSLAHQNCHQFKYSAVIPFDMKLAISAAWEFLSRDQLDIAGGEYRVVASSESTIACKSIENLSLDGAGDARVRMRCVLKKMEDRERILLVWFADTGPELNRKPSDRAKEVRMGQRGWAILSDASTSSIGGGSAATAIQICVRLDSSALVSPSSYREHTAASDGSDSARAFSDRFVRDAQEKFGIWYQYVENILLERQRALDSEQAAVHTP